MHYELNTLLEKNKIAKSFNRAARTYDAYCDLQMRVGKALISHLLTYTIHSRATLDVGCGTGILTQQLTKHFKSERLLAVDIAGALLECAKDRKLTTVVQADFDHLPFASHSFDVLFSNMALQWSLNIVNTMHELQRVLRLNGLLMVAVPVSNNLGRLSDIMPLRYNELTQKQEFLQAMQQVGFHILHQETQQYTMQYENVIDLYRSIKNVGAHYCVQQSAAPYRGKEYFQKLLAQPATFEHDILFVIASSNS